MFNLLRDFSLPRPGKNQDIAGKETNRITDKLTTGVVGTFVYPIRWSVYVTERSHVRLLCTFQLRIFDFYYYYYCPLIGLLLVFSQLPGLPMPQCICRWIDTR